MLTQEDFKNFCISKGLISELVSIENVSNSFKVTIKVRGNYISKNYSAIGETTDQAFASVRKLAFEDIEKTVAITTEPIENLKNECKRLGITYTVEYWENEEGFWGKIILKSDSIPNFPLELPFEAPSHTTVHHCAAEKAQSYFKTIN